MPETNTKHNIVNQLQFKKFFKKRKIFSAFVVSKITLSYKKRKPIM